jgi:signal transduction histidine kinase
VNVATDAERKTTGRKTICRKATGRMALPPGASLSDLVTIAIVVAIIELNVAVGGGSGAAPLNAEAYTFGAVVALPLLLRRRWPLQVLCATCAAMVVWYIFDRRNISPATLMAVPVYDAALAGYLAWAIGVPALIMTLGIIVVGIFGGENAIVLLTDFLPSFAIFTLAVALGEVVRSRRALAAETAIRLRLAEDERRSDAARLLAEERLRLARELHDTVAHGMATITVQASAALHLLSTPIPPNDPSFLISPPHLGPAHLGPARAGPDATLRDALLAIRETSKDALAEMRAVLGQLRGDPDQAAVPGAAALGLSRLPELRAAITAAGSPVTVIVEGNADSARPMLPPPVDHAAYRILQESLTNVLRHAPAGTPAEVCLSYTDESLTITVSDTAPAKGVPADAAPSTADGVDRPDPAVAGNGIQGMRERAASVGGSLEAAPRDGGFTVTATLPRSRTASAGAS